MTAQEIAAYLAGAGLGLSTSAPANLYSRPLGLGAPDAAVHVVVTDGSRSDRAFGTAAPVNEYPRFQVMVREAVGRDAQAEQLCHRIYVLLEGLCAKASVTLSGTVYRDIQPITGPPKFLSYDGNGRPRYYCEFEATKDRSA